jgi:hypothetical protein
MAIFEDVNGVAHAVSTAQHSRGETSSEGTTSSKHNRDGSVETSSHTVTTRPDGKTVTVLTLDTTKEVNGTVYHTDKVFSDDGQGHRSESLSNSFEQNKGGAHIVQTETVTKQLGAHEARPDLTKALEERGTLGVTHDITIFRETHDKNGAVRTEVDARHFDTVGNQSASGWGSVSFGENAQRSTDVREGSSGAQLSEGHSSGVGASASSSYSHSEGVSSGHTGEVGVANNAYGAAAAARYLQSHSEGVSSGHTGEVGVANNAYGAAAAARYLQSHSEGGSSSGYSESHGSGVGASSSYSHSGGVSSGRASTGLSAHVSQSIENRLVSEGYSAAEARETVKGVSESLGHAVNAHTAGTANSVEFHKEGPVAVSMTSGPAVSSGTSVAISMDELKAVHESGQVHSLQSGLAMRSGSSMSHGASMEMSR